MVVLGIWAGLIGYTIVYAGLCNWQGTQASLPDVFLGKSDVCKCPGSGGKGAAGASRPAPPMSYDTPYWSAVA